jgi:hypothetical protein
VQVHLDADAGEGAALGEVDLGQAAFHEIHLGGVARPEGEGEGGFVALALDRQNLAVGAVPELVFVHGIGEFGEDRGADKPGVRWRQREFLSPMGLIFAGRMSNFAAFTAQNHPGRFPTGPPPSK